jgi:hypothetical protein
MVGIERHGMYILASIVLVAAAALIFFTWPAPRSYRPSAPVDASDLDAAWVEPIAIVKEQIEVKHPATYFVLAQRLFALGGKDEAVFWFYVGVVRYRGYLAGPLGASEAAQFQALWETVEPAINDHAFGDIRALAGAINRALAWDEMRPDPYVPQAAVRDRVRNALRRLRFELLTRRDAFRERAMLARSAAQ